jgi:hypothetical protein
MNRIETIEELKDAIRLAEDKQSVSGNLLKKQFLMTCDTLKPGSLLRSTIKEVTSHRKLVKIVALTALALTTSSLSKKIVIGTSGTLLIKILAGIIQHGTTRFLRKKGNQNLFPSF